MRIGHRAIAATLGVAIVAVAGAGIADASTSAPVRLGRTNATSKPTTIKDSKGPALSLKVPSNSSPMKVNSSKVVTHLNADLLDGQSASALGQHTLTVLAEMSDFVGIATCPTGTHPVGGGVLPDPTGATDSPVVVATMVHINDSDHFDGWEGIATDGDGSYTGGGFVFAACATGTYTPYANLTGAARQQALLNHLSRHAAAVHQRYLARQRAK